MNNWKRISGVLGALVLVSASVAAYDKIRPWPTVAEHLQVAGRSCENMINSLNTELRDIERRQEDARSENNFSWLQTLNEQHIGIREEIERVKRERGWK